MTKKIIKKIKPMQIVTDKWYNALCEEVKATAVETIFSAQQTVLEGKYRIGELLNEHADKGYKITALVQFVARDIKVSERDLYYCYDYYQKYDELKKNDLFNSKLISWNKVKKLMSGKNLKKECQHLHKLKITICEDCGKKCDE